MTTREPESSQTVRDTAALLERRIAAARPAPDFADMLLRARELAPGRVSEADVARAGALPPVPPPEHGERTEDATALAPFAAALRAEMDAKIAERRMASIPPVPLPRRSRFGLMVGLALALAAAVALILVRPTETRRQGRDGGAQASDLRAEGPAGEARRADSGPQRYGPPARPDASVADVAPVLSDSTVASDPAPSAPVCEDGAASSSPVLKDIRESRPRARTQRAESGPSLEDEAQQLWERGELAAAEQKLRQVLALAGRSGRAELAYGDLFALVRQLRGADGQFEVWREYLRGFPAGRFADDVRAGLCLRAGTGQHGECWRDYLKHHPQGIHRVRAEAALAEVP